MHCKHVSRVVARPAHGVLSSCLGAKLGIIVSTSNISKFINIKRLPLILWKYVSSKNPDFLHPPPPAATPAAAKLGLSPNPRSSPATLTRLPRSLQGPEVTAEVQSPMLAMKCALLVFVFALTVTTLLANPTGRLASFKSKILALSPSKI